MNDPSVHDASHWFGWPARRPRLALCLTAAFFLIAIASITRLSSDGSLAAMFPENQPSARALAVISSQFPAADSLWLVVTLPPDAPDDRERLVAYAQRFESEIAADKWFAGNVTSIAYRSTPEAERFFRDVALPHLWLYLDERGRADLQARLEPEAITTALQRAERAAATPGAAGVMMQSFLYDPLQLRELVQSRFTQELAAAASDATEGLFLSRDGRSLLIQIGGAKSAGDMAFVHRLMQATRSASTRAEPGGLSVGYTGAYAIANTAERSIRSDMIRSITGSLIMLQCLFLLTYRWLWAFPIAFAPVAVGVTTGFAVIAWLGWPLSPPTAVIGAILAGLGLDYAIHYMSHYHAAADRHGRTVASHVAGTLGLTLVMACLTSVAAFAVVALSDVPALRHFSVIGVVGLMASLVGTFVLLPAVLVFAAGVSRDGQTDRSPLQTRWRFDGILLSAIRWRRVGVPVMVALALAAAALLALPGGVVRFNDDLAVMHPKPNAPLALQEQVTRDFPNHGDALLLLLEADSDSDLVALAHQTSRRLMDSPAAQRAVASSAGLHSLLPDPLTHAASLLSAQQIDPDRVVRDFGAAVADSAFSPEAFTAYREYLRDLVRPGDAPGMEALRQFPDLAGALLPHAEANTGTNSRAITVLFLREAMTTSQGRADTVNTLRLALNDLPGVTLTGMSVVGHDVGGAVAGDLAQLAPIAAAFVGLLLLLGFRSLRDTAMALVPLVVGMLLLLAWMKLVDVRLNMVNLVSIPLLVGLGVDDGVFTIGTARSCRKRGLPKAELLRELAASCHAVTITSATTLLAFGSLMLTSTPAIRSMGQVLAVGVVACWAATVLLLVPLAYALHPNPTSLSNPTPDDPPANTGKERQP